MDNQQQLDAAERTNIGDLMTPDPVVVRPDSSIETLVEVMLERGLSRVPVVDAAGRLVGMVSKTDLVVDQHVRGDTSVDQNGADGPDRHVHELGATVGSVMTPDVLALPSTTSVGAASRLMLVDNLHAVPVISETGRLIGMFSATDVMAWVAGVQLH